MNCAQYETNIDEPARPKAMSRVRNRGAEIHRAGRILHGVVQKRELTDNRIIRSIRQTHLGSERARAHLLLHSPSDCFGRW